MGLDFQHLAAIALWLIVNVKLVASGNGILVYGFVCLERLRETWSPTS